ncbi:MAG: glutamate-5-semialdehyde dehydrogenase [Limnochordales bacterium]|nr:glutamate-5-semialdehyde dehydrogenase [Limnochordales bacterium]
MDVTGLLEKAEQEVAEKGRKAQAASRQLAVLRSAVKDRALLAMADALLARQEEILEANRKDYEEAAAAGRTGALLDRLKLTPERIAGMARGLRNVAALPDPVGEGVSRTVRPNGLVIEEVRVPLGVVGIIYEARPNVTADAAGLCLKAGNAVILRGGHEALRSNMAIVRALHAGLEAAGVVREAVQLLEFPGRESAQALMRAREYVDVLIPRGGAGLIQTVVREARVPVIETGVGNCHTFVDATADLQMALNIVINAKCQRPSVCNAMETLLVHKDVAATFLPQVAEALRERGVELRGCPRTQALVPDVKPATEEDWYAEYLDLILAVKVVDSLEEAIAHINRYGSRHSEAIVTNDYTAAQRFLDEVDAACVYVNASTRFSDGEQFGLGAEIGISTQKLHARGPMGLRELTTVKFRVYGNGQVRES